MRSEGRMPHLLLLVFLLVRAHGTAEEPSRLRSLASPDKRFVLNFTGPNAARPDGFELRDSRGAVTVSSSDFAHLRNVAEFLPDYASWSPDGQMLAIAGGHGH